LYNVINENNQLKKGFEKMSELKEFKFLVEKVEDISDGYHTFKELYHHRMVLFSIICNQNKNISWKSFLHQDGTMFKDYFIVGIDTVKGQYSYHYHKDNWNYFKVKVLEKAPAYDGHKPNDIDRLKSIL
jgi:hypothetical protein